jgi:hypothetical protein
VSAPELVAFVSLQGQLAYELLQPSLLLGQTSLLPPVRLRRNGITRMRQQLIPPLIIWRRAELIFIADDSDWLPLQPLHHDYRCGVGIPLPAVLG